MGNILLAIQSRQLALELVVQRRDVHWGGSKTGFVSKSIRNTNEIFCYSVARSAPLGPGHHVLVVTHVAHDDGA